MFWMVCELWVVEIMIFFKLLDLILDNRIFNGWIVVIGNKIVFVCFLYFVKWNLIKYELFGILVNLISLFLLFVVILFSLVMVIIIFGIVLFDLVFLMIVLNVFCENRWVEYKIVKSSKMYLFIWKNNELIIYLCIVVWIMELIYLWWLLNI